MIRAAGAEREAEILRQRLARQQRQIELAEYVGDVECPAQRQLLVEPEQVATRHREVRPEVITLLAPAGADGEAGVASWHRKRVAADRRLGDRTVELRAIGEVRAQD